jgi:hypothetical protein
MNGLALRPFPLALAVGLHALTAQQLAPLWLEPRDLSSRDLFWGPGGRSEAPQPGAEYRFVSADTTGHSRGFHVEGPDGRKWKIKIGDEVQSEIAVSRILWAIGYHQPALYYLDDWHLTGGPAAKREPGRFRLNTVHKAESPWAYDDNPFVGTRELHGLIVANVLLNNWDLEPGNNRIYEVKVKHSVREQWYVAQDLGGSLGKTRLPIGTRNRIEDFESQGFIAGVRDGHVEFDYHGPNKALLRDIAPEDVRWVCGWLAKLSDAQLADAFRAAGYPPDIAGRYVRKIRDKIRQGAALSATVTERR